MNKFQKNNREIEKRKKRKKKRKFIIRREKSDIFKIKKNFFSCEQTDTSTMLITFILIGKNLEAVAKGRTCEAIEKLISLQVLSLSLSLSYLLSPIFSFSFFFLSFLPLSLSPFLFSCILSFDRFLVKIRIFYAILFQNDNIFILIQRLPQPQSKLKEER